ncbi:MAG: FAD:protein FMN transferase [Rhizobiaceae bacterium]|nr:FAD:protein FMN transferase [Rhizobiaceae bacterium]
MSRVSRRRFLQISAAVTAIPSAAFAAPAEWRGFAFGAEVSIKLYGGTFDTQIALDKAVQRMIDLEKLFSIYDPESAVSELNRSGILFNPPDDMSRLLAHVDFVHEKSSGLFDPTVQRIFEAKAQEIPFTLRTAMSSTGWNRVSHDRQSIRFPDPKMGVTFNGIAQGFITDEVRNLLSSEGFFKTLVNIGEYAVGDRQARIGIADHQGNLFEVAELRNQAIATTSPDGYRFRDGSSHIISPDGRNLELKWKTVSVVADSAVIADGFSTALALAPDLGLARKLRDANLVKRVYLQHSTGEIVTV